MAESTGMVNVLLCSNCGTLDAGPREICPSCHESALKRHEVAGDGRLLTWTIIRRPPAAFRSEGSYAVAVIELAGAMGSDPYAPSAAEARLRA